MIRFLSLLTLALFSLTGAERSYGSFTVKRLDYVIDGDTFVVTLAASYPALIRDSLHIRIYGINTPELHAPDSVTRSQAVNAKAFAAGYLQRAKRITLQNVMRDKYFRCLAVVKCDTLDLGAALIRAGLAVPYFGGTK